MRKGLIFLLLFSLVLSGCGLIQTSETPTTSTTPSSPSPTTTSSVPTSSPTAGWTGLSITWTQIEQGNFPPDRFDYDLTYDSKRDRLLFFGGATTEAGVPLKDLWAFDFSTNRWELLSEGKELPSPLLYPHPDSPREIVYDPLKDRLLLFQCSPSREPQLAEENPSLLSNDTHSPTSEYEVRFTPSTLKGMAGLNLILLQNHRIALLGSIRFGIREMIGFSYWGSICGFLIAKKIFGGS